MDSFRGLVKGWLVQKFWEEMRRYPTDQELEKLMTWLYHNGGMAASISIKGILNAYGSSGREEIL